MLKKCFALAALCSIALAITVSAHHGVDHHAPPVAPPAPQALLPPPPPPPPVVTPPPINFTLPLIAPPSTILPTDTTGFHAGPDANQAKPPQPLVREELAALTPKDPRFNFSGEWIPFSADYSAILPGSSDFELVGYLSNEESSKQFGRVDYFERSTRKVSEPVFMPTIGASYSKVNDDHLTLNDGAILVRAGERPVFVSTKLCDERVVTRVSGGSIAMISAFDQKPMIFNLTDKCCGALIVYLPSDQPNKSHAITMKPGHIAEAYRLDTKPTSHLVAARIDVNQRLGPHCGVLVSQCHYIRALKKFNLVAAMPKDDLDRVLKTAAAISHVRRTQ